MDEVYLWKGDMLAGAQRLYSDGRYKLPKAGKEAKFTSQPVTLDVEGRRLAPPSAATATGRPGPGSTTVTDSPPTYRILHAAWTWYPELVGDDR